MRRLRYAVVLLSTLAVVWALLAYWLLPLAWTHYEHQRKLAGLDMVTHTGEGIPGDPINVGLVGSQDDVLCAMHAAGWYPADPVTLRTSIAIVGSVLLDRPYRTAPVSPLFFQGRREDLAFEKPIGSSADHRNHFRVWQVLQSGDEDRAVWLGAATQGRGVGFSHDTGAITHHIAPDIDDERALLASDLMTAKVVEALYEITGVGPTLDGRNGGGDRYFTDGEIVMARLVEGCGVRAETPKRLENPVPVKIKNRVWRFVAGLWRALL